jgi:DNA-binding MarR family transcriptional regulator
MGQVSSKSDGVRAAILTGLEEEIRKMSAQSVLFSAAISARLGINSSDLESLDILHLSGATTAGQLAVATGLTTGAITGVIDRLEQAGYVRRRRDPRDRRRVIIEALPSADRQIAPMFASLSQAMKTLWSTYSERDLELIRDWVAKSYPVMVTETAKLRDAKTPAPQGARIPNDRKSRHGRRRRIRSPVGGRS